MSWFKKLQKGLSKSSKSLSTGLTTLFTHKPLDDEALQNLEDLLIQSDMGVQVSSTIIESLRREKFNKQVSPDEVKLFLAEHIARYLDDVAGKLVVDKNLKPEVILVVGVNGAGKTTTIAKLSKTWTDQGIKVRMAAGDTFRAAAVEQLCVWGDRLNVPVTKRDLGSDAAALAFDAVQEAKKSQEDVVLIDTAGRLHTNSNLMEELRKVSRVIKKASSDAPHEVLLVLDATIGQNAYRQVEIFMETVGVTGLIMTKLDGSAKGGVLVGLAQKFGLPIYAVGVGEQADDLQPFDPMDYAKSLVGYTS